MNKIVLVTGGFDPIHSGHISYFNAACKLGSKLIVGVNSDNWLKRKKGRAFMCIKERLIIIKHLKMVDEVCSWNDDDNTACNLIKSLLNKFPKNMSIIFANGGDRNIENIPEKKFFINNERVEFVFGVGGCNKRNSSSNILNKWNS